MKNAKIKNETGDREIQIMQQDILDCDIRGYRNARLQIYPRAKCVLEKGRICSTGLERNSPEELLHT